MALYLSRLNQTTQDRRNTWNQYRLTIRTGLDLAVHSLGRFWKTQLSHPQTTAHTRQRPYWMTLYLPRLKQTTQDRRNTWNQYRLTKRAHLDLAVHSLGRFWKTQLSHPQTTAHTRQRPYRMTLYLSRVNQTIQDRRNTWNQYRLTIRTGLDLAVHSLGRFWKTQLSHLHATAHTRQRPYRMTLYLSRVNQTTQDRRNTWNQLEYTKRAHLDLAVHSLGRFWKTQLSHPQTTAHTRQRPYRMTLYLSRVNQTIQDRRNTWNQYRLTIRTGLDLAVHSLGRFWKTQLSHLHATAHTRQRPYRMTLYLSRVNQTTQDRRNTWNQLEYTKRAHLDLAVHSLGRFWKTQLSHPQTTAHTRQKPAYTPTIKHTN
jgi:isoprenylcysteine carboxyl methyltransferase (ICMT) family protein YpbQ